jgi:hypothetical protein
MKSALGGETTKIVRQSSRFLATANSWMTTTNSDGYVFRQQAANAPSAKDHAR